jgi:hypothetical protein
VGILELVALVKRLRRRNPKTGQRLSLRSIAAELERQGFRDMRGVRFKAASIQAMVGKQFSSSVGR